MSPMIVSGRDGVIAIQDLAYMLKDTEIAFNLCTLPDERWDIWIDRHGRYQPLGKF